MNETVSIIVPVYKVEAYLDDCVRALLAQTYRDIEILLIDDGSPDRCPQMCDQWAAQDIRVRVIHKKNGGAASARNAGLDAAKGAYVCFVDSDDTVEPEYIRTLLQTLQSADADIAVCGFSLWSKTACDPATGLTESGVYSCRDYLQRFLADWSCSLLWNKLYRRETVGDLRMDEGHRVDDEFFTYRVFMNCARVAVCDVPLYNYRLRASSAMQDMTAIQEQVMLERILYITTRYNHISEKFPELEEAYFYDAADTLTRYRLHSKAMPRALKALRRWSWQHLPRVLKLRRPIKQRLVLLYLLLMKKPRFTAEGNPLERDVQDYFQ